MVLCDRSGQLLGALAPVEVGVPWLQEVAPLVDAIRDKHNCEIHVLRLLEAQDRDGPIMRATYLAELCSGSPILDAGSQWAQWLPPHPLRMAWAKPGGPAADLAWASAQLERLGYGEVIATRQVRSWNLSSIWALSTRRVSIWLKVVPPFFVHEGAAIRLLGPVGLPKLVAHEGARLLMHDIPGEDRYAAGITERQGMIRRLVGMQFAWHERVPELLGAGLPDLRDPALLEMVTDVISRVAPDLPRRDADRLQEFARHLPERLDKLAATGIPETLVHGDCHPGNWRGDDEALVMLDWGDAFVGHPLLDAPALLVGTEGRERQRLQNTLIDAWREYLPESDPAAAFAHVALIAAARQAAVYQAFLDRIEPTERVYHADDPVFWLKRLSQMLTSDSVPD